MASKNLRDEHLVSGYYFTVAESLNNMRQSQIIQATSSNSVTGKSLSLDENLSRLFECLKLEYGSNYRLVSPKWKNFRSQKLPFSEKTRLNNAIWRCWHIQYLKGRRPYFCQFVSPLSEEREPPKKEQLAVILEGRYWKRKLEAVAREYKRWRVYYKEKWSRSTPETALENLSIQAQICDQQIFDDLERRQKMRKRTISGSSGDPFSAASPTEYCPSRALKMVQEQMTQEMVLSVYPDTLFTSTTNDQQASSASSSFGPTDAPDLFLQPRLDNLQPCLDEFMEQFDTLTNLMVQNEAEALAVKQKQHQVTANMQGQLVVPGQNRPRSLSAQYTRNPGEIEMMDATGYNSLQVQDYSGGSGSGSRQVCTLTQELCPGTLGLSADYDRLSVQLEQPPEQMQQDNNVFGMQQELSSRLQIQSPTNITSPLPNSPISSPILSSPGIVSPVTTATLTQPQMLSQQRLNRSGSLSSEPMLESGSYFSNTQTQEMSAPKKGRLPRNVSDSQLYTMDLSQLGSSFASTLHNTSLMPSLESNLPPQLQAPNLAAHLQSVPSRTSRPAIQETRSTTGSQPKKARIPRNMSDSGLYTLANLSKTGSSSLNRQMSSPDQVLAGQLDIQAQDNLQTQTPAHPVRQPRMTGKRRGRIPRNMSDSSLMTIQNLPRNMSDSSLLGMHQKQQQQQQQQHLQAPTVASLLMGDNATRRGNVSTTPNSLADLLSSTSSNQVFVSSEQTNLITTSVPFSSSSSAVREVPPSTLIDQLLKEPTAQLTASSLPSSNILEALVQTTTQKTSQTSSCILTSATSTQPVVVQPEESAKMSPQQQLLKHLLALQKDKQPLPTHLLAALQASVDQHSLRSKQNGARLQHQQQLQQQNLQQKVQHEQQHQQGHQNFMQVQQQQEQVLKAQQYNLSPAQPQTQQMLPQQNAQTDQKEVSPLQAVLQIPSPGLQPTQPLVVGGNSETQNFPPGTLVITPQQLQLASLQNLPSKVVTLQQNNPQPVQSPPVSGSSQIVEIVQGNGPPQKFVLPTGMKIRQGVQAVVAAPELSSLLLGQQQSQTPARGYSTVQSPSTSSESTESIAAALVSMATSPVVQQPPMTTPAQVPMVSIARSTSSQDSASERAPQATPTAPKPIRPVCSYDREQYKETRRISHISAEQKRRGNIKMGFDELVLMVPSLAQQRNVKVSKATVLQKTVEYTMKLQRDRQLMSEEIELLQHQKEELKAEIDACQQQLPATGAPVMTQRSEQLWAMFNEYVRSKTQQNYKFWIFSLIIRPLFETYISSVSTSSVEEFCRTVLSWLDQRCSLPALRPIPVAALRELSQHTSILTDPSKIADEAQKAAAVDNPSSISGSLETIFGGHDGSSEVSNGTEFSASLR